MSEWKNLVAAAMVDLQAALADNERVAPQHIMDAIVNLDNAMEEMGGDDA